MNWNWRNRAYFEGENPPNDPPTPPVKTYTQAEFEAAIQREKNSAKESNRKLLADYEQLKTNKALTEEERANLQTKIDELTSQILTKEELQKKQFDEIETKRKEEVGTLSKERDTWKGKYESTVINRAIVDAAVRENAFDPTNFAKIIDGQVIINKDDKVVVKIETEKDGKPVTLTLSPDEAVKRMKDNKDKFGYLFKNESNSGTGSNNLPKNLESVDFKNMTPEQYAALRPQLMTQ